MIKKVIVKTAIFRFNEFRKDDSYPLAVGSLNFGLWTLDFGLWILDFGLWTWNFELGTLNLEL
jgi:hypothetical protein